MARLERQRRLHPGAQREAEYALPAPAGIDSEEGSGGDSGIGPAFRRWVTARLRNSDFADPPEDLTQPIDDDNNPLPDWSFVRASGASIDAQVVADSSSASGYVLQWTMRAGAAGDDAYIEQIVPINASRGRSYYYRPVLTVLTDSAPNNMRVEIETAWLASDEVTVITGGGGTLQTTSAIGASTVYDLVNSLTRNPPANASYMRVRAHYLRSGEAIGATGTVTFCEARVELGSPAALVPETAAPATYAPASISQANGATTLSVNDELDIQGNSGVNATLVRILAQATTAIVRLGLISDGNPRLQLEGDSTVSGALSFGPGSASALDARVYRSATKTITVDDATGAAIDRFEVLGGLRLSSSISPAQIVANTDNYAPTGGLAATVWRINSDAAHNLTGISIAQVDGDTKMLANIGAFTITLVHDATSTAANRFYCPGSANFSLTANRTAWLWYDATSSRWRVIG